MVINEKNHAGSFWPKTVLTGRKLFIRTLGHHLLGDLFLPSRASLPQQHSEWHGRWCRLGFSLNSIDIQRFSSQSICVLANSSLLAFWSSVRLGFMLVGMCLKLILQTGVCLELILQTDAIAKSWWIYHSVDLSARGSTKLGSLAKLLNWYIWSIYQMKGNW